MKKYVYLTIVFIILIYGMVRYNQKSQNLLTPLSYRQRVEGARQISLPTTTLTPTPGIPVEIDISSIKVHAPIESVGLDITKAMDVPRHAMDAGWYNLGSRPGQTGSAVIDGHLDLVTGAPAVFWNITKLQSGDQITITDDKGQQYTFIVTNKQSYPFNNFPIQQVFSQTDKPRLNLITCQGTWDKTTKNYSNREVIYSELKN